MQNTVYISGFPKKKVIEEMKKRENFLPFALPFIDEKDIEEVTASLKSGWISSGPKKQEFEKRFKRFTGTKHAVAMNSCTAALHTALLAKGIGRGDEVITTPFTFCSTVNTIVHTGAKPVLVDIEPDTYCIDTKLIEDSITDRTKAIIPVHYGGQPCEMDSLIDICKKNDIFLLEDAAHALTSEYKGRKVGTLGDAAAFSFYATKNITTSDGGMLATDNDEIAKKARILSMHGINNGAWKRHDKKQPWYYDVEMPGFKYAMTDIQASLGLRQLEKLETMQNIRQKHIRMYKEAFEGLKEITIQGEREGTKHSRHLFVIRINKEHTNVSRQNFVKKMKDLNIGTSVHFIPIHYHPYYKKTLSYKEGDFPVTESVYEDVVSLPVYPSMTKDDTEYVIDAVYHIFEKQ